MPHSPRIHTFIGTSPLHRAIPETYEGEMADRNPRNGYPRAQTCVTTCQWSPDGASADKLGLPLPHVEIAIQGRGTTINIPDTVAYPHSDSAESIRKLFGERARRGRNHSLPRTAINALGMDDRPQLCRRVSGRTARDRMHDQRPWANVRNTALEEVGKWAMKGRATKHCRSRPRSTATSFMNISRRVLRCLALPCSSTRPSVGRSLWPTKAAFTKMAMLKNAKHSRYAPRRRGPDRNNIVMGKHSGVQRLLQA